MSSKFKRSSVVSPVLGAPITPQLPTEPQMPSLIGEFVIRVFDNGEVSGEPTNLSPMQALMAMQEMQTQVMNQMIEMQQRFNMARAQVAKEVAVVTEVPEPEPPE